MSPPLCRRGEIWVVNLRNGRGSEQRGVRPALIIQNDIGNHFSPTTIIAAITTNLKKYPVTVLLDCNETGLKESSAEGSGRLVPSESTR